MAYYDALIAHWPSVVGANTAAKLAALNAETVTGSIPATFYITGDQLLNCLDFSEFNTRTTAQQANLMAVCSTPGQIKGGAASFVGGMFVSYYSNALAGPTIAALTALAKAITQPWWQANGYPRPFDLGDIAVAGLS